MSSTHDAPAPAPPPPRGRIDTLRVLAVVAVLCTAAVASIVHLTHNSNASVSAQLQLESTARELIALQAVPFRARPSNGGTAAAARARMQAGIRRFWADVDVLEDNGTTPSQLRALRRRAHAYFATLRAIYLIGISPGGYGPAADRLGAVSGRRLAGIEAVIRRAAAVDDARARRADDEAQAGTGAAIAILFCVFACFQRRSARARDRAARLAQENARLLRASRREACTDQLTGMPNRRALERAIVAALDEGGDQILVLFDLDGFKQYNDTFGHPAGDLLLQRLGHGLREAVGRHGGSAYRMGGDEFCVLAPAEDAELVVWSAWSALSEHGDGFEVAASYGVARLPEEADSVATALHVADMRLYDDKASGRPSADRQSTDVLMALMDERGPELREHVEQVAALAELTARRLGLPDADTRQAALAARLHDVGKAAIPDTIVGKPGTLDAGEWQFMHRHTVIGERIIAAAPALGPVAAIVRSTHERYDGRGYPDGLAGETIPLAARIIAVCDAYETMTSDRVYHAGVSPGQARAELLRNAGTQFDPVVVDAFCSLPADQVERPQRRAA
jgi:diguanylate cyclase (GGDEF)-like protein